MSKLPSPARKNPTLSASKVVASRSEQSRFIRQSLAALLRFIRRKRSFPDAEGDLSSWILFMHGFQEKKSEKGRLEPRYHEDLVLTAADFLNQRLGPGMDVQKIKLSITETQKITNTKIPKMAEAHRRGNLEAFRSLFSQTAAELMDVVGTPRNISQYFGLSFDRFVKLLRGTRATLICLVVHNEHPLALVARAGRGGQEAVLSLVKADKLFVQDSCCAATIRKAALEDDQDFIRQLANALEYQPKLSRRDVLHIYCYTLFFFENWGVSLPSLNELWSTLDPYGREYDSLSAFEKDFQRRRRLFGRMLASADAEVRRVSKDGESAEAK